MLTTAPEDSPNEPEELTIGFVNGTPATVNGQELDAVDLLATLNKIGGRHGIGRIDLVEDRLVGMKSRGVYETPGGAILHFAHRQVESLTMDREAM